MYQINEETRGDNYPSITYEDIDSSPNMGDVGRIHDKFAKTQGPKMFMQTYGTTFQSSCSPRESYLTSRKVDFENRMIQRDETRFRNLMD